MSHAVQMRCGTVRYGADAVRVASIAIAIAMTMRQMR